MLLERLMSLEIEPGDRIAVDNLVREFGVSQTPIREALSQLETQGLVVKTHLVGYRAAPHFSISDFEDLYEVRRLLEPQAAARACRVVTADTLTVIDQHLEEMERLRFDGGREAFNTFARRDVEFHSLVADASSNRFLRDSIKSWSLQFHLFRRGFNPGWLQAVMSEHVDIVRCIRERREDQAASAMGVHIENSYVRFQETMAVAAVGTAETGRGARASRRGGKADPASG